MYNYRNKNQAIGIILPKVAGLCKLYETESEENIFWMYFLYFYILYQILFVNYSWHVNMENPPQNVFIQLLVVENFQQIMATSCIFNRTFGSKFNYDMI